MPRPFEPVAAPALAEQDGGTYPRLVELVRRLLAPDGCPWDREQTFESMRRYVLEEAAEVVDAVDGGELDEVRAELGDLLLQIVFLGELGRAADAFGPDDVVAGIVDKLVRRHPHVFGDVEVASSAEVLDNWERIKAAERAAEGGRATKRGVLGGVPKSLPALLRAQRLGEKARNVGFGWPDASGPRAKLDEEVAELDEALASGDADRVEAELGDALFCLVNVARHAGVDAEAALRRANTSFTSRFRHVERMVDEHHGGFAKARVDLETLEGYWQKAKERDAE
jgi:nucleoside triphosphate diphosphatase